MRTLAIISVAVALLISVTGLVVTVLRAAPTPSIPQAGMVNMETSFAAPPVMGYLEGQVIQFIHTEASDQQVAGMLTQMMGGSPVLVVPSLADVPDRSVAPVYVFQNGVAGTGPFGFQPDVFAEPPGSAGYTPLRRVHVVRWQDGASARELRSAAEIVRATNERLLAIERTEIIVNMPFLTWPGGHR